MGRGVHLVLLDGPGIWHGSTVPSMSNQTNLTTTPMDVGLSNGCALLGTFLGVAQGNSKISRHFSAPPILTHSAIWQWLEIKELGQTAGFGFRVSTYRSCNPFWNSGYLSHTHLGSAKLGVFLWKTPCEDRPNGHPSAMAIAFKTGSSCRSPGESPVFEMATRAREHHRICSCLDGLGFVLRRKNKNMANASLKHIQLDEVRKEPTAEGSRGAETGGCGALWWLGKDAGLAPKHIAGGLGLLWGPPGDAGSAGACRANAVCTLATATKRNRGGD